MTHILDQFKLNGRSAVVTGGGGLLGSGFCHTLAQAGASVIVADQNLAQAQKVAADIAGNQAIALEVDVTEANSVQKMITATRETFARLDILVCSAALDPKFDPHHAENHDLSFENFPLDSWQQALDVNLTGVFLSAQAAAPIMLEQGGGVIVMISSIYGFFGPDQRIYERSQKPKQYKPAYYSASKAGVLGLMRYLATYYAGKNIRVNALSPGGVYNDHEDAFVQEYAARTVLGRMAEREELNAALLFLASDASSYMTGSNLVVDGGWTAW